MTADLARIAYAAGTVRIAPRTQPISHQVIPAVCSACGATFRPDCLRCAIEISIVADTL